MTLLRIVRSTLAAAALAALAVLVTVLLVPAHSLTASLGRWEVPGFPSITVGVRLSVGSSLLLLLVTVLGAVVAAYCVRNLAGQRRVARFAALELSAVAALGLAVSAASLPLLAVGWTAGGLAVATLVAHADTEPARNAARLVRRRLLLGDAALWGAVVLTGLWLDTFDLAALPAAASGASTLTLTVLALLVVVAGCVRSALVPAHRWLPETAEAPSPVSALLHAGLVNGVGVLALAFWPVLQAAPLARAALLVAGAGAALLGTAQMRTRPDVKGRLAASTSAQMGYLAVEAALGLPAAVLAHVVGHGLWKASAFLGAGDAVARVRAGDGLPVRRPGARVVAPAATAAVLVALVAGALVPGPWGEPLGQGPAELVPLLVAGLAAAVALSAGSRTARRVAGAVACVLVYLLAVRALGEVLRSVYAAPPAWGAPGSAAMLAIVIVLVAVGVLAWRLDAALRAGRYPAVARWVIWTSAPVIRRTRSLPVLPETTAASSDDSERRRVESLVDAAADLVGPVWPLAGFVASNPLARLEGLAFADALALASGAWGATTAPAPDVLRTAIAEGRVDPAALADAVEAIAPSGSPDLVVRGRRVTRAAAVQAVLVIDLPPAPLLQASARRIASVAAAAPSPAHPRTPLELLVDVDPRVGRRASAARAVGHHVCAQVLGASTWPVDQGLWSMLQASWMRLDRTLGVRGAGEAVRSMPADAGAALGSLLDRLAVPDEERVGLLARLLARDPGWAGHLAWRARQGVPGPDVTELLALRLVLEVVVAEAFGARSWKELVQPPAATGEPSRPSARNAGPLAAQVAALCAALDVDPDELDDAEVATLVELAGSLDPHQLGLVRLRLLEEAYRHPLVAAVAGRAGRLAAAPGSSLGSRSVSPSTDSPATPSPTAAGGPDAQLVTCIDVRSEPLRRHLEALGPWETFGAAGFFGLPLRHVTASGAVAGDRCPALIRPSREVHEVRPDEPAPTSVGAALHEVEARPVAPFALAEAAGWVVGPLAALRTLAPRTMARLSPRRRRTGKLQVLAAADQFGADGFDVDGVNADGFEAAGFDVDEAAALAEAFLRGAGLLEPAPVVVLCGHGGATVNNPHVAAYDCGACGGWAGDVNARAMAQVLNDPQVRGRLAAHGLVIPERTRFVPALHDTTRDRVQLLEPDTADAHDATLARLRTDLDRAGDLVALERSTSLPGVPGRAGRSGAALRRHLETRAVDWAQPRPEWGLAGCAAMVIGPRSLTAGLDLGGRVFLQSYRPDADPDGRVLEGLLSAPLVVAEWIAMQYWASTVDPERFGAGDKTTHNALAPADGTAALTGVVTGARGDLRIGLPWQAVGAQAPYDGQWPAGSLAHEPLRLLAVVCASPRTVESVLARCPDVARLVLGEWIALTAIDPATGAAWRRDPERGWVRESGLARAKAYPGRRAPAPTRRHGTRTIVRGRATPGSSR